MNLCRLKPSRKEGFTLTEWLVALAAIAILACLTLGGFRGPYIPAERNRTITAHAVIKAGLEQYKERYGDYPEPSHPSVTTRVDGLDIRVGSARMLYQALTGDGDSEVKRLASAQGDVSDGKITDEELEKTINGELVNMKNLVVKSPGGYYLADGWQRPFQYIKGGNGHALNPTYDLWSFGAGSTSADGHFYDPGNRQNVEATARWIKNW